MMRRELGVGTISGRDGQPRVLLRLPTWEDYVGVALDETIAMRAVSLQVGRRVDRLLTELVAIAPPGRGECLQARL
jgi:hypothetical protein